MASSSSEPATLCTHANPTQSAEFIASLKFTTPYRELDVARANLVKLISTCAASASTMDITTALLFLPAQLCDVPHVEALIALIYIITKTTISTQQPMALVSNSVLALSRAIAPHVVVVQMRPTDRSITVNLKLAYNQLLHVFSSMIELYFVCTTSPIAAGTQDLISSLMTTVRAISSHITPATINIPMRNIIATTAVHVSSYSSIFGINLVMGDQTNARGPVTLNDCQVVVDKTRLNGQPVSPHEITCTCQQQLNIPLLPVDACSTATMQQSQLYYWAIINKVTDGKPDTYNRHVISTLIDELSTMRGDFNKLWRTSRSDENEVIRKRLHVLLNFERSIENRFRALEEKVAGLEAHSDVVALERRLSALERKMNAAEMPILSAPVEPTLADMEVKFKQMCGVTQSLIDEIATMRLHIGRILTDKKFELTAHMQ
jgi:hypothetical protein